MSPTQNLLNGVSSKSSEPIELRIATSHTRQSPEPAERQLDQLLDILAIDQLADSEVPSPSSVSEEIQPTTTSFTSTLETPSTKEISIVIACHNHAATVGNSVLKAIYALEKLGIEGEVILADAGSRDDSVEIADALGARIVHASESGVGAAIRQGVRAAQGKFILLADGDDRCDFATLSKFYDRLCEGADIVQGCRTPQGGGRIMPGAMNRIHSWSNRLQSQCARVLFRLPIHDIHCSMRGFRKDFFEQIDPRSSGPEIAAELLIKSVECGARISEIPITYYKSEHPTCSKSSREAGDWMRTLRYYSFRNLRTTWLYPAAAVGTFGMLTFAAVIFGSALPVAPGIGTMLIGAIALVAAVQLFSCGVLARVIGEVSGLRSSSSSLARLASWLTYERCITASCILITTGTSTISYMAWNWIASGLPSIEPVATVACLIPAAMAILGGIQIATTCFLAGILRMQRRAQ